MKADSHIHGHYSSDSSIEYSELCTKAIESGYTHIAITEHFDLVDSELAHYGLLPLRRYFNDIKNLKAQFPQLHISTGIELGEPHRCGDFADRLFVKYKPEYIIGSLHITRSHKNVSLRIDKKLEDKDIIQYYTENLEMVEKGGFDTLGHLGIYKRGLAHDMMPDETIAYKIIDQIFITMIKNNISLEVNNSSYKSNLKEHLPEPHILKRYKKLGGNLITIGSDSHDINHFDLYYKKTLDSLRLLNFICTHTKVEGQWMGMNIN